MEQERKIEMEKNQRPNNQEIVINFYKGSGKWYASGKAIVNHFMFEDGFKQDIVNTQNALSEGWQEGQYFAVTSADENIDGFYEALWSPLSFSGLKKID